jgi:hypothetical protein
MSFTPAKGSVARKPSACLLRLVLGLFFVGNAFGESTLSWVSVSTQSPTRINAGENTQYIVTAARVGNGSMDVYCTVSGLPAGAAASFSPGVITFLDDSPSAKSAMMTISTSDSTPPGLYNFTITGRHGNSSKIKTCSGTLIVGANGSTDLPQRILSIDCQVEGSMLLTCSGKAGNSYVLQASTSLSGGGWTNLATLNADANGLFTYVDTGATNCVCRFYRTSTP